MSQNIVFVGAGGAGVSSLVLLFHELAIPNIIAIDSTESELTQKLTEAGIQVIIGHGTYDVQQDDIIIYSDAAAQSHEVLAAHAKVTTNHKRIFPPMSYFQFLGELSKYMQTVAVAGTHGKSTTTALTATALATHHPDFGLGIVGAPVTQRGHRNFIIGENSSNDIKAIIQHILFPKSPDISAIMKTYLFVIEADEYNHHFLHLDTDYAIITNIELDHADVYGTFDNYLTTFYQFADKVRHDIYLATGALGTDDFIQGYKGNNLHSIPIQTFGFTHLLGAHNHTNASLALGCTQHLLNNYRHCEESAVTLSLSKGQQMTSKSPDTPTNVAPDKGVGMGNVGPMTDDRGPIIHTLSTFQGLRRRGEFIGENKHGVPIITDYAHHPSEIASTLIALREKYPDQHITCIFQPHQARRVTEFRDEFTSILPQFDTTIIYNIYTARESIDDLANYAIQSNDLKSQVSSLKSFNDLGHLFAETSGGTYITNFEDIKTTLNHTKEGVIIIFTAGNLDWEVRKYLGY